MAEVGFGLLSTVSASVAGLLGIVFPLCSKKRTYTSASNRIMMEGFLKKLPPDATCIGAEVYTNGSWVPTTSCSISKCYCTTLDVHVSEYEANQVSYQLSVILFPCMTWGTFEKMDVPTSPDESPNTHALKAPKLPHLVRKGVQLAWPSWSIEHRYVLPPGVDESELKPAISLATRMMSQVNDVSGSAVFMVRGPKRTGKSSAAKLLAQMLGPRTLVCEEYNPTEPGNILANLVSCRQDHDQTAWLVIILEECDEWLQKILDGHEFPANSKIFTEVTGKSSWCQFPEKILKMERVVVVCNSNMTDEVRLEFEEKKHGAMLRAKRMTAEYRTTTGGFDVIHESNIMAAPKIAEMSSDSTPSASSSSSCLLEPLLVR